MPIELTPFEPDPNGASSPYFAYEEFEVRFGRRNIARYSRPDQDNQNDPDFDRVQFAFDTATGEIENFFIGSFYEIPFVFSGEVPAVVRKWAMTLAYADLYLARGMSDEKQPTKIQLMRQRTLDEMALYRGGQRELSTASRRSGDDSSPNVVAAADVSPGFYNYLDGQPIYGWRRP